MGQTAEDRKKSVVVNKKIIPGAPRKSILRPNFGFAEAMKAEEGKDEDPFDNLDASVDARQGRESELGKPIPPPKFNAPVYSMPP